MAAFNWTCPHCNFRQTVSENRHKIKETHLGLFGQIEGQLMLEQTAIGCVNPDCGKTTLRVKVGGARSTPGGHTLDEKKIIFNQRLIPQGAAKPQPDYVPEALREDYYEACLIRDFSPKASATLIRRCLQGMIRDFAKITKATLDKEIKALREAVDNGTADRAISSESVDAIDEVRGIGNIGAHMEKDINLIIEVDPGEAQALIQLTEMLFEEWYGARHRRKANFTQIASIAGAKKEAKKGGAAQSATAPMNALMADPAALQAAVEQSLAPIKTGEDEGNLI